MQDYLITVDDNSEELMHYGVLGMKWHHHRATTYASRAQSDRDSARMHARRARKLKNNPNMKSEYDANIKEQLNYMNSAQRNEAKSKSHLEKNIKNRSGSRYNMVTQKDINKHRSNVIGGAALAGTIGTVALGSAISSAKKNKPKPKHNAKTVRYKNV